MDGLKTRLTLSEQNKLLESQALEFKGRSMLGENFSQSTMQKSMSKDNVTFDIQQLDAMVFFAYSNEIKFNVFDRRLHQFRNDTKETSRDLDVLGKFEKTIYDSIELVSDLRMASNREKTIAAKFRLLKRAGHIENHAVFQMGKLLYIYFNLPEPYNSKWLTSADLTDPYNTGAKNSAASNKPKNLSDTSYQRHLNNAMEIFNLMEVTEQQIGFFNEFLAIKYPQPGNGIDFIKVASSNLDSLKLQWQAYLYNGGSRSDSSISGLLTILSKERTRTYVSSEATLNKPVSIFSFKIQILASRNKLNQESIQKRYQGKERIDENLEEDWYKYTIGNFKTYKEARLLRDRLKVDGSFIVAYLNGKRIEVSTYSRLPDEKTKVVHEIGVR